MLKALRESSEMFTIGDIVRLISSIILLIVCIVLIRRKRNAATSFLLLGSSAYAAKQLFWAFMLVLMFYKARHPFSTFARVFFPTSINAPWTGMLYSALFYSGIFMLSVGVILRAIDATRTHLTKRWSEPPPSARSHLR
jgi:hypothetical protein